MLNAQQSVSDKEFVERQQFVSDKNYVERLQFLSDKNLLNVHQYYRIRTCWTPNNLYRIKKLLNAYNSYRIKNCWTPDIFYRINISLIFQKNIYPINLFWYSKKINWFILCGWLNKKKKKKYIKAQKCFVCPSILAL